MRADAQEGRQQGLDEQQVLFLAKELLAKPDGVWKTLWEQQGADDPNKRDKQKDNYMASHGSPYTPGPMCAPFRVKFNDFKKCLNEI